MSKRKDRIATNELSALVTLKLAGVNQKVLIEGKRKDLPVFIVLHGGPGSPVPFNAGSRGMFPEYTDQFVMVYWDQLGCGINYDKNAAQLNVNDYVTMTIDLAHRIREMFPQNKLFFYAISWGSVLSTLALSRESHLVDGVLAWGHILQQPFVNPEVEEQLKHNNVPKETIDLVMSCSSKHFDQTIMKSLASVLNKKTTGYVNPNCKVMSMSKLLWGYLTSPDYKLKNLATLFNNPAMMNIGIYQYLFDFNPLPALEKVEVPYHILRGDLDIICSSKESLHKLMDIQNPNLKVSMIENCSHMPNADVFERSSEFLRELVEIVM